MIGAYLCKHGLHKWSRASVVPQPTFRLVGRVCLRDGCDERRVEIDGALGAIDTLMQDARAIDLHGDTLKALSGGCTRCFPKPVVPAVGGLDGLLGKYARIKREFDEYDGKRKQYHDAKKELAVELVEVRDQIAERVGDGVTHESMHGHTATRSKAGSLIVKLAEVAV